MALQELINTIRQTVINYKKNRSQTVDQNWVNDVLTKLNQYSCDETMWDELVEGTFLFADIHYLYQHAPTNIKLESRVISNNFKAILNSSNINHAVVHDNIYHLSQLGQQNLLNGKINVTDVAPLIVKFYELNPSKKEITVVIASIGDLQKNGYLQGQFDQDSIQKFYLLVQTVVKRNIWINPDYISDIVLAIGRLIDGEHLQFDSTRKDEWRQQFLNLLKRLDHANFLNIKIKNLLDLIMGLNHITQKYDLDFDEDSILKINLIIQKLQKYSADKTTEIESLVQATSEIAQFVSHHPRFTLSTEAIQALTATFNTMFENTIGRISPIDILHVITQFPKEYDFNLNPSGLLNSIPQHSPELLKLIEQGDLKLLYEYLSNQLKLSQATAAYQSNSSVFFQPGTTSSDIPISSSKAGVSNEVSDSLMTKRDSSSIESKNEFHPNKRLKKDFNDNNEIKLFSNNSITSRGLIGPIDIQPFDFKYK